MSVPLNERGQYTKSCPGWAITKDWVLDQLQGDDVESELDDYKDDLKKCEKDRSEFFETIENQREAISEIEKKLATCKSNVSKWKAKAEEGVASMTLVEKIKSLFK